MAFTRYSQEIQKLKEAGTYKGLRFLKGPLEGSSDVEGYGESIMLCSNNYIGLANKPELVEAGQQALGKYGAGASSVRFICGTFDIHRALEQKIASFLGKPASLTYTSCWAANTAVIPTLLVAGDTVISDELNHASIIDGCRMVGKGVNKAVYKHSDMQSLEEALKKARTENPDEAAVLVVTDGVFSMEGDIAKLPEIIDVCKRYNALLMVDESHATGVIGKTGRGTCEYYGIDPSEVDIISGTLGKALGGAGGGFIAASVDICDYLIQKSRPHLFSNSLPPVLCGIAIAAFEYLEQHPQIVSSLMDKVNHMRNLLKAGGLNPLEGDSAIIPIIVGKTEIAIEASRRMMEKGVYAIGFGFPVVPEGAARIRVQVSDALSYEQLDKAAAIIIETIKSL